MDHVPQLLLSEFTQAQHLLYDELMLGAQGCPRMHAWALKDNLKYSSQEAWLLAPWLL